MSLDHQTARREGASHPDRNAQFEHINARVKDFQQRGQPVVSVDTKKKERVGSNSRPPIDKVPQTVRF